MSTEKRQQERRTLKVALIYYFDDESSARRIEEATLTLELSGSGLSMVVQNDVPLNAELTIKLLLRGQQVQCTGRVANSEPQDDGGFRVGVALDLDDRARGAIDGFLERG